MFSSAEVLLSQCAIRTYFDIRNLSYASRKKKKVSYATGYLKCNRWLSLPTMMDHRGLGMSLSTRDQSLLLLEGSTTEDGKQKWLREETVVAKTRPSPLPLVLWYHVLWLELTVLHIPKEQNILQWFKVNTQTVDQERHNTLRKMNAVALKFCSIFPLFMAKV
jgi:hypothetical protein